MPMLPPVPIVPSGAVPFNGNQSMGGNLLQNLGTPLAPTDSAPKGYVDSAASGLAPKLAVQVATAIALPANTYSNGSSGVGATLTGNAVGELIVDSHPVALNDRILVQNEVNEINNGPYMCTTAGSSGAAYVLTRATDANTGANLFNGSYEAEYGTFNGGQAFYLTNATTPVIGTDNLIYAQYLQGIQAGPGLHKFGQLLEVDGVLLALSALMSATITVAAQQAALDLVPGTNVEAWSAVLDALASVMSSTATAAAQRGALGLGTVATEALDTDGTLSADSDANVPSQKAVKSYVDASAAGLVPKIGVLLSTQTALPANTYNNGTAGVGATLSGNSPGVLATTCTVTNADAVDDYIRKQMEVRHIPGLSLAVVRDGKVVRGQGYGHANVELNVPAAADTVYEIGSITKQFTSCLVMMMVEEGKLALDDPISKHLDRMPASWKPITVRQLLTHTSGIKGYTELPDFEKLMITPATHAEVIKSVGKLPLEFKPGERWQYSNTGYYVLGMILEKVSGKSYSDLLQARILKPLDMAATRINSPEHIIPNRAAGYQLIAEEIRNAVYISMDWPFSAGVLVSTINDLVKWDAALSARKLLKAGSWKQMWTPVKLNDGSTSPYGFGWSVNKLNGHANVAHGGGIPGFTSYISRFPDDNLTVILLCNQMVDTTVLANNVTGMYVPALTPVALAPIEDKEPKVTARIKLMIERAADGKVDAAQFTPELGAEISSQMKQGGTGQLRSLGPITSMSLLERSDANDSAVYRYRIEFKAVKVMAVCAINKDGKFSSFGLSPE